MLERIAISLVGDPVTGAIPEPSSRCISAAHQNHRPASGRGHLDRLYSALTHLKSGDAAKDRIPLLTAILADAINMGLTKMAEACPGASYAKLSWLQAWHIRDETYSAALAELVNAQFR